VTDEPIRWGILATGKIAHTFAADLMLVPDATLVAVGSRRPESARAFAAAYDDQQPDAAPIRAYGSYEELVADPDVDVVYVASPHSMHLEHATLAFEAGKHVLSEKAIALTVADAETMIARAREHDRFLMEAMWTACHPAIHTLRARLASGELGAPRQLHAELGFRVDDDPSSRMLDPRLGAGALLDMGIYPLTFAHLLLGEALELRAVGDVRTTPHGSFDMDVAMVARHAGGVTSTLTASMSSWSSRAAAIATDLGRIDVADFHHPSRITFTPYGVGSTNDRVNLAGPIEIEPETPVIGGGYGNEIAEVDRCLRAGLRESPLVPHAQTLTLMRRMEDVLTQLGVDYTAVG
jgi:predicted dehydrogenase